MLHSRNRWSACHAFLPNLWLYCLSPSLVIIEVQFPIPPMGVAAPGSDITLRCSFSSSKNLNLNQLVINWQRGESMVVHSYYHGRDQLDRVLFTKDALICLKTSSLRVTRCIFVRECIFCVFFFQESFVIGGLRDIKVLSNQPKALCTSGPLQESTAQLSVQSSCDSFIITLTSSQGFPQPDVHGRIGLDSRGRYEVHSSMEVRPNSTLTIIAEMRLEDLNQSFTRSITLHPLPGKALCIDVLHARITPLQSATFHDSNCLQCPQ
uniref:Ig-like domain-containing protein n=1 Tax=Oncorhynchus tshawytscha TaxID=74940 RepID=A0A8C8H055_ONCTS